MSRQTFEEVLGKRDVRAIWGSGFDKAIPVIPQNYVLGSVIPAVLFLMRWGHRRGKGKFTERFGNEASVGDIAGKLIRESDYFRGFDEGWHESVLADLLLAFCFENRKHRLGRSEPVQRIFATHYFSSWVDLPQVFAHLRRVPEMLTALMVQQQTGPVLTPQSKGHYTIGSGFDENMILGLFGQGAHIDGEPNNLRSDHFDEATDVGIDQLLAIRIAMLLGEAPTKASGEKPSIPNQLPVATKAARFLFEDFNVFVRSYSESIPRQSLVPLIESCLAVGLSNIFLSTLGILLEWAKDGFVPSADRQNPWGLFVDCSASNDEKLRRYSEESVDDLLHRLSRFAVCSMCLRILDQRAEVERFIGLPASAPDPTDRLNYLGDLLFERVEEGQGLRRDLRRDCLRLSDALREDGNEEVVSLLESEEEHPAWRLAEATVFMMGEKQQGAVIRKFLDSSLMMDLPNGIGRKRKRVLKGQGTERRSIVLTNTALDFLVHRHLRKSASGTGPKDLSLNGFISILKERYGFYVDESPEGMSIPDEHLRKNRAFLERRLRDLGLFVGVNDAEAMKRLKQRFEVDTDV